MVHRAETGSAMSTQPQNIHLICFAAYSGLSCTPQPHCTGCSFLARQAQQQLRGQQRGRLHLLNEVHNCSGFWAYVGALHRGLLWNEHWFSDYLGRWFGLRWEGWDLDVAFKRGPHMSSSSLHWEKFKNLPGFLN